MQSLRSGTLATVLAAIVLVTGCAKRQSKPGPQATVMLHDGSSFAGTVIKSSPSEITLAAPNGEARTYPMNQVDSVQYQPVQTVDTTQPPAAVAPGQPQSVSPQSTQPQSAPPQVAPLPTAPQTATAPAVNPTAAPPQPTAIVRLIPAGTNLVVRNNEPIDSKTAATGQTFSGVIARNVLDASGRVAIPHGSPATLVVRSVQTQGQVQGRSELALDLDSVSIDGRRYRVETSDIVKHGADGVGENKRTAKFLGGGTALGALLGAVAGGGRGAAIGAVSGAAAGGITQTVTRGHGVRVAAETLMTFRLEAPVRIREMR